MTGAPRLVRWETLLIVLWFGTIVLGAVRSPYFLDGSNFSLLVTSFIERAIMALPMTLIIIAGQIDLSVASTLGLASATLGVAWQAGYPLAVCIGLALLVGAAAGLFNGVLVAIFDLPSLVVTLGTLALYRGLAFVVLGQQAVSDYPAGFRQFGFGKVPGTGIPWPAIVFTILLVIFLIVLHRSSVGRQIYAIGGNATAARFSAVRVTRITIGIFIASGLIAALAGVIFTARVSSSRADNAIGFELDVIAAVLLGGVSIFGGRGTLVGVTLSLLTLATLRNALALSNVGADTQNIAIGGLLILSVLGPNLARRFTSRAPSPTTPVPRPMLGSGDGPSPERRSAPEETASG